MSEDQRVNLPLGHNANGGYGFAESGWSMEYSGIVVGKLGTAVVSAPELRRAVHQEGGLGRGVMTEEPSQPSSDHYATLLSG